MRILMLAQFYPPVLGGEERHVKILSEELVRRGHSVAVATLHQPGLQDEEEAGGARVYRLPSTLQRASFLYSEADRRHAPPFPDPETTRALSKLVKQFQPEIVHAHNWLVHSYLPIKNQTGVPLVLTLHDYSLACPIKRLMYKGLPCSGPAFSKCLGCSLDHYGPIGPPTYLSNRLMGSFKERLVDRYLAVSRATAEGNGLSPGLENGCQVIPNFLPDGFDDLNGNSHPLAGELPEDGFLMFAGDLSRDKGVPVLLEAYRGLVGAPPLVLIGRKTATTPEQMPPDVHVFNSWPHPAVLEAWLRSSIALAPSVWPEPFGIVVIEAMAAGKPVIASQTGGLPDIVRHGETGLLVMPGSTVELRQALQRLIHDPERRARMGHAGRRRIEMFKAGQVVPQIERVYLELLAGKAAAQKEGGLSGRG
jgi:glycosyltransferase involved in cell wall biosynthesis